MSEQSPYEQPSVQPRRFGLYREVDVSGISGTGMVADGVVFPNGWVAIGWRGVHPSLVFWPDLSHVEAINGHGGHTRIVWLDSA